MSEIHLLIALCSLNTFLCLFLAWKMFSVKSIFKQLEVEYFIEQNTSTGLIKNQVEVKIKCQLLLGGIPVGHAFVVSEQTMKTVDKEQINQIVERFAKPFLSLGLKVASKKLI